jgi:hypothetical protein
MTVGRLVIASYTLIRTNQMEVFGFMTANGFAMKRCCPKGQQ